ncbi:sensor histidine kinase [Ramlibacter alkalitolerans]|uniref:histidine kinase n=1 Tax=Ramlibacter alkalitolerans TaxID=2039631 RepID=A0ABS1JI98_9BURK|nr:sensor histidine kinase [Ramlibacter alkalitolerans]MBL0423831.1 sensor histidine kinase N-terminal domain-containing protein [Ramlibacter alkalitolerans]
MQYFVPEAGRRLRASTVLGVTSGLQRRLLVMLIVPLVLLAALNAWFEYRSAGNAALQQDHRLQALVPLVADSIVGDAGGRPLLMLAPPVQEFLKDGPSAAAYAVTDIDGNVLQGDAWLNDELPPADAEPQFHSEEHSGATWRIVRQRQQTIFGEVVVAVGDGTDPRQQWARSILFKVLLPNLVLIAAAAFAVGWAVERALRPLRALKEAVERRSPRDLSAIDESASPEEVRPLVDSLNRLFGLVNAQADGQRRFVADAAHQLRTPLAGLQAQVEAWAQAAGASPQECTLALPTEQVYKLRNATRRTSQLANQLLALSRADARGMHSQPQQRVDLKALCEDTLEQQLDAATARGMDLGLDAEPVHVMGHDWLLRELLANLVDNAVKYSHEGGCVTIRCGQRGTEPFLEVEDDGPGVSAAERPRILERFYRVQGTQGEGNGLGLAIAEEIARVHHSHLQLSSGAGGSGLKVTLPLPG